MNDSPSFCTHVQSSLLISIAYSLESTLELEFRSGAVYRYFQVPRAVAAAFLAAESKGAFFNRHVRNHFRYRRLT